jgi:hypothetical protein
VRRSVLAGFFALVMVAAVLSVAQASTKISCPYSHSLPDDPIVHPADPGASHQHDFFGNVTTDAFSTTANMKGQDTTCQDPGDTAGYWAPTLYYNGTAVHPGFSAYYYRRTDGTLTKYPRGFQMLAGNSTATEAQSTSVVYYGCGSTSDSQSKVNYLPDCTGDGEGHLYIHVLFPWCSATNVASGGNDTASVTYGPCDAAHPYHFPQLVERFSYPIVDATSGVSLSSGAWYTFHADYFSVWNRKTLAALVAGL